MSNKTIFVQIASYRDPQLIPTISNLIDNVDAPSNLRIVVCWQHGDVETLQEFSDNGFTIGETLKKNISDTEEFPVHILTKNGATVELIDVHYTMSRGACWARNAIQQLYQDETYTLQLDSHHRFVEHFDTIMVDMIEGLRKDSKKPLITGYIPSFDPETDPASRISVPWKMDFDRFIPEGAVFFLPSSIDDWKSRGGKPMKARFYSAHFAFADGSFAREVQHDPEYFFHGEEISIAVRAYTHGYDLYHPTIVVAWHEYTRKGRTKIWDDHTTTEKLKGKITLDWVERNNLCHSRNRILFGMDGNDPNQIDFGKYGFGTERTVRNYEEYAGISFAYRGVQQETLDKKEPPNSSYAMEYSNEEEWKNTFVRSNDIRICFHRNELGELQDDYDFWYVGCHDSDAVEIFRKDAQPNEIREYLKNDFVDFRLIFLSNRKPATYTVWVHSASKGWLNKIDKVVTEH